jgi:hypothetical protein
MIHCHGGQIRAQQSPPDLRLHLFCPALLCVTLRRSQHGTHRPYGSAAVLAREDIVMDTTAYYQAITRSDELLRERRAEISAAEDTGSLTAAEAAHLRVVALENHLAACQQARAIHLDRAS